MALIAVCRLWKQKANTLVVSRNIYPRRTWMGSSVCAASPFWIFLLQSQQPLHHTSNAASAMRWLQCLLLVAAAGALCSAVMMTPPEAETGVDHCLKDGGPVLPCLNAGALEFLEEANQRGGLEVVEGLELVRDDGQAPRTIVPVDQDPHDYRSVLDATAMFLERRSLRWDLGLLYPGLTLRVGPTLTGHGLLEFLLDHRKQVDDRAMSTGKLILKRTLLPLLLGVKLNVVTLVPIIFGILVILIKKALFIGKAALLLSSVLGYNQLQHQQVGFGQFHSSPYNFHHGGYHQHVVDPLEDTLYKAQSKYRHDLPFVSTNSRDFSWTERDKKKSVR